MHPVDNVGTKTGRRAISAVLEGMAADLDYAFGADCGRDENGDSIAQCMVEELNDLADRLRE